MAGLALNADLHVRPNTYMTPTCKKGVNTLTIQDDPLGAELTIYFSDVVKVREMASALTGLAEQMAEKVA